VRRHWLQVKTKCNSCASLAGLVLSFIACFILLVITPLPNRLDYVGADSKRRTWELQVGVGDGQTRQSISVFDFRKNIPERSLSSSSKEDTVVERKRAGSFDGSMTEPVHTQGGLKTTHT